MTAQLESLDDVLDSIWNALEKGVASARHAFHTGVLATTGDDGPEQRTVVLRDFDRDRRSLACHTDLRSAKPDQIRRDPRASWLFYDPGPKVQLRFAATASVHTGDELSRRRWAASSTRSRACYAVDPAPGTPLDRAYENRTPDDAEIGLERFAVIGTHFHALDWLHLSGRGHRRARFEWTDGSMSSTWVVP